MHDSEIFDKAITWAQRQGLTNIKANHGDFEMPSQFKRPGEDQPVIPDITGFRTGNKNYIEIAEKTDEVQRIVSRWKLLGTMAAMKGGKLYLLAPRGHKAFTEDLVTRYNLSAKIVSI